MMTYHQWGSVTHLNGSKFTENAQEFNQSHELVNCVCKIIATSPSMIKEFKCQLLFLMVCPGPVSGAVLVWRTSMGGT